MSAILAMLLGGSGGGVLGSLFGGVFGLFKQNMDRKERIELERIRIERDKIDLDNDREERNHQLLLLEKTGGIQLKEAQTEAEAEMEIAYQDNFGKAQMAEFSGLITTPKMDNYRSSVRPTLAYWFSALFSVLLIWAFCAFSDLILPDEGKLILTGLFATLTFTVSNIITFYYVSRKNTAPGS
jgi:hypothetical protein